MNRMWCGLLGVAVAATSTGCRHSCGSTKCGLFNREPAPTQLASNTRGSEVCSLPTPLGYPSGGALPIGGPPMGTGGETIPPTFLPATPSATGPSAKNVLPMPGAVMPQTGTVGFPK